MAKKERQMYNFIFNFDPSQQKEILIHNIISSISVFMEKIEFSTFYLGICGVDSQEDKQSLRVELLEQIESKLGKKRDFTCPEVNFLIDFKKNTILVCLLEVFVSGNYCKFLRNIAQTQHFCKKCKGRGCEECNKTGKTTSESVEELLASVLVKEFDGSQLIFHGAGREDVDVLMLGAGRPFIAEITIPKKRNIDLEKVENEINKNFNGKISVSDLKIVNKSEVSKTKDTAHDKIYSAVIKTLDCFDIKKIERLLNKEIKLEQLTPTRVSKRRALMKREKFVTFLSTKKINENEFELVIKTSHGTYVKEFISGDENKTTPNISLILETKCVCVKLDVLEIL